MEGVDRAGMSGAASRHVDLPLQVSSPWAGRAGEAHQGDLPDTRVVWLSAGSYVVLRREGGRINHKKTRRIYRELGLQLRNKTPKRRSRRSCGTIAVTPHGRTKPGRWTLYMTSWRPG